jgi:hypothetical protein
MTARATRRQVFGASAAMLLMGATEAGAAKAAELDGELIALCAEVERLNTEEAGLIWADDAQNPRYKTLGQPEALAALRAASARLQDVLEQIAAMPARTPEGLRAKAQAVHAFFFGMPPEGGCPAGDALWSLVCDVAGRAAA